MIKLNKIIPSWEQYFCISRHIGRGAFGEVFQGIILPNSREQHPLKVAIKVR